MEIPETIIKYKYHLLIAGLLLLGIGWRLIPHLPNFAPIGAIAIMAGMMFRWRRAVWLPIIIMAISDAIIGPYQGFLWTWLGVALIPLIGILLRRMPRTWRIPAGAVGASLIFFVVSNFGVWVSSGMYSHTLVGLIDCYAMALPFLRATILSDLVFTGLLLTTFEYVAVLIKVNPPQLFGALRPSQLTSL